MHSNNVLSVLKPEQRLGFVDPETLPKENLDPDEERMKRARANMPPLSSLLSLKDIEVSPQKMQSTFTGLIPPESREECHVLDGLVFLP